MQGKGREEVKTHGNQHVFTLWIIPNKKTWKNEVSLGRGLGVGVGTLSVKTLPVKSVNLYRRKCFPTKILPI